MNILTEIFEDNMTHIHVHTEYSMLDGGNRIKDCIKRVKELGMTSIAMTDHNHLGGVLDFQKECKANNIKPIYGVEMYQTWDSAMLSLDVDTRREHAMNRAKDMGIEIPEKINGKKITKKQINDIIEPCLYDTKQYHIILLAMNQTGFNNLMQLQSEAADLCTYNGRFCCDFNLLRKYNEGIICTSACLGGIIPNQIIKGNIQMAEQLVLEFKDIFQDRFFLEIQPLDVEEQQIANVELVNIAEKYDIELVATNDIHYTYKEDFEDHDTLLCIGIGKTKDDEDRMHYAHEFWIRSYDEMIEAFSRHTNLNEYTIAKALANTNVIASMIEDNIKIGSDVPVLPPIEVPKGLTPEQYFTMESYKGLYKYYNKHPEINIQQYERRLHEELNVINPKGFAPYMLLVKDLFDFCDREKIPTGPGRGSAAGSLALFVNGITKVMDPIKYGLLFFRFLTKDRVDLPDIDSDFSYYGRDKVIRYLEEKYGAECVSHIGTYTEIGVKSGLKDFGRVLRIPYDEVNNLTKQIDEITNSAPSISFKDLDEMENSNDAREQDGYRKFKELEDTYTELFRLVRKFEGIPRNMGSHASGILTTPVPVSQMVPTRKDKDGIRVTLFTGPQLEECKLVKLDILGLKTLDVLDKTLKAVDENLLVEDLYKTIEDYLDNEEMFSMIQNKETEGVFQIESNLFKGLMNDICPNNIDDIIALLSIGRPGPLSAGMHTAYGMRKNGFEEAVPQLPNTEEITQDTFHTILYQEQLMLIAKKVAGFNDSQSDSILRKAVAKKKKDKMELSRQLFIYGKLNETAPVGYDENNKNQPYYDPTCKLGTPILGGINNGYTEKELSDFWVKMEGYATYLFNRSHSASYAVLTLCTMYLKRFYTTKFIAALLSMQSTEEKIDLYSKTARFYGINITTPDVNYSDYDFKENNGSILYGLKSIKGIGEPSIEAIIENRPYTSLEDSLEKIEKKLMNKRVGTALIKAGAFSFVDENRYKLLNQFMEIRKDKDDRFIEDDYSEDSCIELEQEVLGTNITYIPWWDTVTEGETVTCTLELLNTSEKKDKKGNMMGFVEGYIGKQKVKCLAFASIYCKNTQAFDVDRTATVTLKGTKDNKGTLIIKAVIAKTDKELIDFAELDI